MIQPKDNVPEHEPDDLARQIYLDALNAHLAKESARLNRKPDPAMGNLSPEQVHRLIYLEWGQPGSVIQFNPNVPKALLNESPFFKRARYLLCAVRDRGGVKTTVKKNLPRAFIEEVLAHMCRPDELELIRRCNKVLNEEDVGSLHVARVVCQVAEILRIFKGKFIVSKSNHHLLDDSCSDTLFEALFFTYFTKFNIAYLYHYGPDVGNFQRCVGYSIFQLGHVAEDWRSIKGLAGHILLPKVREDLERELIEKKYFTVDNIICSYILRPMLDWGLLEGQYKDESDFLYRNPEMIRITPLYRELFRFAV